MGDTIADLQARLARLQELELAAADSPEVKVGGEEETRRKLANAHAHMASLQARAAQLEMQAAGTGR